MFRASFPLRILITAYPFDSVDPAVMALLTRQHRVSFNEIKREYTPDEIYQYVVAQQPDIIVAGIEKYTEDHIRKMPNLKLIARVGVGLDSVPVEFCRLKNIDVCYTPYAPTNSVAEYVLGQTLCALRHTQQCCEELRQGQWNRYIGRELQECTVGIIGYGRIGELVARRFRELGTGRILANDIVKGKCPKCYSSDLNVLLSESDIITVHIPLCDQNRNFIDKTRLDLMKKGVVLINTSRGGIINEDHLFQFLILNTSSLAIVDVFEKEPYNGPLTELTNCIITPHLGSCTKKSRRDMESGAINEVANYFDNRKYFYVAP